MGMSNRCPQCSADLPEGAESCPQCQARMDVPTTSPAAAEAATAAGGVKPPLPVDWKKVEQALGAVKLIAEIGRGGMGIVYRGHDDVLGRDVAVKFLATDGAPDKSAVRRFLDEARLAAAVRHPNLTQIYRADVADEMPYLVMEFINGPSLRHLVLTRGPMPLHLGLAVFQEVGEAIAELHEHGIIHRDLKSGNVLIDAAGGVFVTDFGLALRRPARAGMSEASLAGTPAYMAPEAFDGQISARSDIYSFGVLVFETLTAELPFSGKFAELIDQHRYAVLPTGPMERAGLSPAIQEIIQRATHKQAMFRYKTATDFVRALKDAEPNAVPRAGVKSELAAWINRPATSVSKANSPKVDSGDKTLDQALARITALKQSHRGARPGPEIQAPALPPPLPLAADQIAVDLPCVHCTYNLHYSSQSGICPECGKPVTDSVDPYRIIFADAKWRTKVRRGVMLTQLPILLIVLIAFAAGIRAGWAEMRGYHAHASRTADFVLSLSFTNIIIFICVVGGIWQATTPRTDIPDPPDARRTCRWLLLAYVAAMGIIYIPPLLGISRIAPDLRNILESWTRTATIIFFLIYVGQLTRTLPEAGSSRRFRLAAIDLFVVWLFIDSIATITRFFRSGTQITAESVRPPILAGGLYLVVGFFSIVAFFLACAAASRQIKRCVGVDRNALVEHGSVTQSPNATRQRETGTV